ncbi:MAG: 2'-5' RNA ligase family protein, partial [Anaerolineales bacterium]
SAALLCRPLNRTVGRQSKNRTTNPSKCNLVGRKKVDMNLCTLAYPEISISDFEKIQKFRKLNDIYYHVVESHITLAFPFSEWDLEPYIAEIKKQSLGFQPFDFCIRCATLSKDAFQDLYHVFLVPDEGYSQILKMHYKLCGNRFFPYRLLNVDFIPHIGIGNSKDPLRCVELVESWNREEFSISGHISALVIANYENDTVETIEDIPLGE